MTLSSIGTWGKAPNDRWVMLRADVSCSGLWHADGCSDVVESLPMLPEELVDRLEAFACWYDRLDGENALFPTPLYWEERLDAPLAKFNAEGRDIARALKVALPSDWTVVYEDVDAWLRAEAGASIGDHQLWLLPTTD